MDKTLSQEEVNALLSGITDGEIDTETEEEKSKDGIQTYDLTSHEKIIRGRMPTLEIMNERFARFFSVTLSSLLRRDVEFTTRSIDIMKFGDFMRKIPLPSSINIFTMAPLRGYTLLILNASMVYLIVDHYFGGSCQTHVKPEGKAFTNIESRIISKIVEKMLSDFQRSWKPVYEVEVAHHRTEINPQFASIVAPTEVVISISFRLDIDNEGSEIYFCIPYSTIEGIKDKLHAGFQSDRLDVDTSWIERLKNEMLGTAVDVEVECGTVEVKLKELLELKVGDILVLDRRADEPMDVKVNGLRKFSGFPGTHKGNQAIQISGIYALNPEDCG